MTVTITQSGDYGATTGQRTVTIPTSGSVTFSVATTDDQADEADGSVTATLVDGPDYDLGSTKTATVTVSDDDATPDYTDYQTLVDHLIDIRDNPVNTAVRGHPVHIRKWNQVLAAIGYDSGVEPMAESQIHANAARWPESSFKLASDYLKLQAGQPVIRVSGGSGISEGGSASFTVSASPAPAANLDVKVTVTQSGDYGATVGQRTVTIPTSGSVTFTVGTTDDQADGSVTATVDAGSGYTVSSSQGAATVAVSDDDDAPPPPPGRAALIAQFSAAANDTSVPPDWQRRYRWAITHLGGAACAPAPGCGVGVVPGGRGSDRFVQIMARIDPHGYAHLWSAISDLE